MIFQQGIMSGSLSYSYRRRICNVHQREGETSGVNPPKMTQFRQDSIDIFSLNKHLKSWITLFYQRLTILLTDVLIKPRSEGVR